MLGETYYELVDREGFRTAVAVALTSNVGRRRPARRRARSRELTAEHLERDLSRGDSLGLIRARHRPGSRSTDG